MQLHAVPVSKSFMLSTLKYDLSFRKMRNDGWSGAKYSYNPFVGIINKQRIISPIKEPINYDQVIKMPLYSTWKLDESIGKWKMVK